VILIDANILLYAYNPDSREYSNCRAWLEDLYAGSEWVAHTWITLWAFIRISTNVRAFKSPIAPAEAFRIVRQLTAPTNVRILEPGPRHVEIVERLVILGQAAGAMVTDAALAAIAIEHGATLASMDRDFSRFEGLKWIRPT
jgi:toxin-antitoxin system PIN domain toxin